MQLIYNFIALFMEAAPWLLLGLLIAGLIKVFVPTEALSKHMGGNNLKSTIKAAFIGAPLPLCSCGVLPAALGLRRSGASKSSTVAFLVATPETGVDSVSVSYALLGPFMAIVRPISAILSAIVAGLLVGKEEKAAADTLECTTNMNQQQTTPLTKTGCCSNTKTETKPAAHSCNNLGKETAGASDCCSSKPEQATTASCCNSKNPAPGATGFKAKIMQSLQFTSYDLIKDTQYWLLIGLFFAALVQTYLPGDFLAHYGHGIFAMVVMVLISIPMYICATASTPIAAGLMMAGISPGAALVFMLAGPATNIAALGLVGKELGRRALVAYLTGVIGTAIVMGLAVDYVAELFEIVPVTAMQDHTLLPDAITLTASLVLALLMVRVIIRSWQSKKAA